MILKSRNGFTIMVAVGLAATFAAMAGCQDPRFHEAQAVRYARTKAHMSRHEVREAARPANTRWLADTLRQLNAKRAEHLELTLERIADWHERDLQDWEESADDFAAWCRAVREGSPEGIPETWVFMVY